MELRYHDYLALITFLDQSPSIRLREVEVGYADPNDQKTPAAESVFLTEAGKLTSACLDYRRRLEARCTSYEDDSDKSLGAFLYKPACFLAFGHADSFAVLAVDAFDPIVSITMTLESPVERHSVGLIPDINSLNLPPEHEVVFASLESLLSTDSEERDPANDTIPHAFQSELPLAQLSLLKVGGLATLGCGLRLRRAAFRAIALRVLAVRAAILSGDYTTSASEHPLIRREDANQFKCFLFEPQDSADVGVFVACRNYSLAVAITTALRDLTIVDLIAADPGLEAVIATSDAHVALVELCGGTKQDATSPAHYFSDNHLFSATYSTLGVAPQGLRDPECKDRSIGGFVSVSVRFDVNPGHLGEVEAAVRSSVDRITQKYGRLAEGIFLPIGDRNKRDSLDQLEVHEISIGRHDFTYVPRGLRLLEPAILGADYAIGEGWRNTIYGFDTAAFLFSMQVLLSDLGVEVECEEAVKLSRGAAAVPVRRSSVAEETGLIDVNTAIVIPVPSIIIDRAYPCCEAAAKVLSKLGCDRTTTSVSRRIGTRHRSLMGGLQGMTLKFTNRLEISNAWNSRLQTSMRRLGLPKSLRRSISYLFQDFYKCLEDPFQFDSVIDLLDSFAALSNGLIQLAGSDESEFSRMPAFERLTFADHQVIEGYTQLVTSLMHALLHRISNPGPHTESWDLAVDVRGGLNKFVAAAEAPWKCGLAFLRHHFQAAGSSSIAVGADSKYSLVGGVIHLSLAPRVVCREFALRPLYSRTDKLFPRIAAVELDVSNLFSPMQFIHIFHEAAHLVGATSIHSVGDGDAMARSVMTTRVSSDITKEELYAGLLTHMMIFGTDSTLYIRQQVASFAVFPEGRGIGFESVLYSVSNFVSLLFLTVEGVRQVVNVDRISDPSEEVAEPSVCDFSDISVQQRFQGVLDAAYQFSPQLMALTDSFEGVEQYVRAFTQEMWIRFFPVTVELSALAIGHFKSFRDRGRLSSSGPVDQYFDRKGIVEAMEIAMESRNVLLPKRNDVSGDGNPEAAYCDFSVITESLRHCVAKTLGTISPEERAIVGRKLETEQDGDLNYVQGERYSTFQIDASAAELACSDPVARRDRLACEIVSLRLMWDASTRQRSRRIGWISGRTAVPST
ncbi:MAG: hypothetical protein JNL58_30070 [Planctomyces sp.]|nr:hypothetical protein [Planctomyces sp.]